MEAVLEGPIANSASVVAEVHNAGVVDALDMQRLQRAVTVRTAAFSAVTVSAVLCCRTAGPVACHSL